MNPRLITVISLTGLFIAGFAINGWISCIAFVVLVGYLLSWLVGWLNQRAQVRWVQQWNAMSHSQRQAYMAQQQAYNARIEAEEEKLQEQMLLDDEFDDDMHALFPHDPEYWG